LGLLDQLLERKACRRLTELRPRLYRLAYAWCHDAHLAEDLVQDTLAKACRHAGQLKDDAALEGWLFAILNNCWRDSLRRRRELVNVEDLDEAILSHEVTPETTLDRRQTAGRVRQAIAGLPLGQRQVITLVDIEECSYAQVAGILGIPVGTVMSRLSRARQALRSNLALEARDRVIPINRRSK